MKYVTYSMQKEVFTMREKLNQVAEALKKRRFDVVVCDTREEAAAFVLGDVPTGAQVTVGGSMTIKEMDLHTQLREKGHEVLWHWEAPPAERGALLHRAMNAPVYLCSANAVTADGLIVQIDGTGNRVAALCYGPEIVYMIVGRNKIVEGGYQQAVRRIKQVTCPKNAKRLNLDTPCATGSCDVSACKRPMCNMILALEGAPNAKRTQIVLVNEDLGF